jgi:hypothetical protein
VEEVSEWKPCGAGGGGKEVFAGGRGAKDEAGGAGGGVLLLAGGVGAGELGGADAKSVGVIDVIEVRIVIGDQSDGR